MREIDEREERKAGRGEGTTAGSGGTSVSSPLIPDWAPALPRPGEQKPSSAELEDLKREEEVEVPLEQSLGEEGLGAEQEIIDEEYSREKLLGGRWSAIPSLASQLIR
jgi:hypothetical protein